MLLSSNACQTVFKTLHGEVEFRTGIKIDFKPKLTCEGDVNVDKYYFGWISGAVPAGTSCNFTVN